MGNNVAHGGATFLLKMKNIKDQNLNNFFLKNKPYQKGKKMVLNNCEADMLLGCTWYFFLNVEVEYKSPPLLA